MVPRTVARSATVAVGPSRAWIRAVTAEVFCPPVSTRNAPTASLPVAAAM